MMDNPIKLLRQLKGAPLSVLLALFWAGQRVSAGWLETMTGYTDKPVAHALELLKEYGWAARVQGGWMIANAEQLPLTGESRNNSALSSSNLDLINNINDSTTTNQRKNSDFSANLITLLSGGIKEPKASALADLEHVTPEFISAHLRQVRTEQRNVATAIYRIENNWEQPKAIDIVIDPSPANKYSESEFFSEVYDRGRYEQ
jgi:hypothetical protein